LPCNSRFSVAPQKRDPRVSFLHLSALLLILPMYRGHCKPCRHG